MTDCTAAAPARVTDQTSSARAPKKSTSKAPAPAPAGQIEAAEVLGYVSVLVCSIIELDDFSSIFGPATELFKLAEARVSTLAYGDDDDAPVPIGKDDVHRLGALFDTALGAMEAQIDDLPRGSALVVETLAVQAQNILRRLSDALAVSETNLAPLKALSTYAGVRPHRDRPTPPTQRAAAVRPTDLNGEQLSAVLEVIAGRTNTLHQLTMLSNDPCQDDFVRDVCGDAAEALATTIGAMADGAIGGDIIGDANHWFYGPTFKDTGKESAA